ncbi:hypothetical protein GF337_09340 [candidate division KSB1 bacterium]|nr:hypothetical protein [candidate division KSB1 bacterium]
MRFLKRVRLKSFFIIFIIIPLSVILASDKKAVSIKVDCQNMSDWSLDSLLYGRFFEHHGNDVYPGIYEQYIINTSFEKWYHKDEDSPTPFKDVKSWIVFEEIQPLRGLAYPFERVGRRDDIKLNLAEEPLNSERSQYIENKTDSEFVGIKQRLALPDYRISEFRLSFYAKSVQETEGIIIKIADYASGKILDESRFDLTDEWTEYVGRINLKENRSAAKLNNRHGIYELMIGLDKKGSVLVDQMTLFPADAVEGVWNPETIAKLKKIGVTTIRWPGGNFASGYHWMDGIGPVELRPTRPNLAWAGLEPNHVGTDEFLQFCELVGLTPLICVGFGYATPEEAANWVEYCNGDISTRFGKLRAQNGRREPYNIKLWQIGNEVYGHYQTGHTTAEDYAIRYIPYYDAMKAVDPSISMMAMGRDPGYHYEDHNAWNKALFKIIGNKMDYLDIHRYVRGVRRQEELAEWDLTRLAEIYLAYSPQYDIIINSIADLRGEYNVPDVKLAVTEWAEYLSLWEPELPHKFSQANGVFYAGMMNSFIRNGEFVKISCSHDFSAFGTNRVNWNVPLLPRSYVAELYSNVKADRLLAIEVNSETFDMEKEVPQMFIVKDIPYIDAVATATKDLGEIVLFIANRSVTSNYDVDIKLENVPGNRVAQIDTYEATDDPMEPISWENPDVFRIRTEEETVENDRIRMNIPFSSVVKLTVRE